MNKIINPYIQDIFDSIEKIEDYVEKINSNKENFLFDEMIQDAVIRRLEVIGEATKKLEKDFKLEYPNIPWKSMAGMRDVLIHDYGDIDIELVWEVISVNIPDLKLQLEENFPLENQNEQREI